MDVKIIDYESKYRDDMLFCYLSAKDALDLGKPTLREDLLDVERHYIAKGNRFWLAIDEKDRVVGMIGIAILNDHELRLHRFFVKPSRKSQGIGTRLLLEVENFSKSLGIKRIYTRFSVSYQEAEGFYRAKGFEYVVADRDLVTMALEME